MPIPWIDEVRHRRQLRVYKDSSMESGIWGGVFDRALDEFNRLARQHQLGVTLTQSSERPALRGRAGADAMISTIASQGLHGHAQQAIYCG